MFEPITTLLSGLTVKKRESFRTLVVGRVAPCPRGLIVETMASSSRPAVA
jgi:hypothetical protein